MEAAEPLTIAYLQKKLPQPRSDALNFEDFFEEVAKSVAGELQLYNSVPVQCAVASERVTVFPDTPDSKNLFVLASKAGKLRIWYDADRSFDYLLCELCLGGTGVPEPEEEGERPPSNFEKRFRLNVLKKLLASVPLAAKRANNADLEVAIETEDPPGTKPEKLAGKNVVEVKFQVSAFSFSSEITLQFLEQEMVASLGGNAKATGSKSVTAGQALSDCRFAVEAFLKPRQITLDQIIRLEVGQVIPLEIGIMEPVVLACENKPVFRATISLEGDKVNLSLMTEILESRRKTDVAA